MRKSSATPAPARAKAAGEKVTNLHIATLLSQEAEQATGHKVQALRRAARSAFLWPEEVSDLVQAGRPLTELTHVGPYLAKLLEVWVEKPPPLPEPNELQREFLTMAEARRILANKPKWHALLKGDLQMHTVWSDGSGSVREMAAGGIALGYEFIAITDHTKGLKIANGLDEARLTQQGREIAEVNKELREQKAAFTVLRAAEVNLSPMGELDMEPASLLSLDLVLGSFHSALRKKEDQTERYLAALRNPLLHVLGHPQGRVFDYRSGLSADWARVFAEAARLDKAVEIDGYADRQDLRVSLLKLAKKEGCRVSLGTDAHHPWQLSFMNLGLAAAAKAGIPAERIINFMPAKELLAWTARLRHQATGRLKGAS
jgi:histidinol phosphatase-like PHP family hydrolase